MLALVMFSACKKDPPILEEGIAKVRFVNAYMNADPQDFYQDQEKLTNNAIAYLEYSDYLTVKSGQSVIWSNNAIENKATAAVDGILYNGYQYTLFYFQTKDSKPAIAGYINEVKTPASGKFKVRFLNLSTSFNDKPLVITGANTTVINAALNYGDNPIYTELPVNSEIKVGIKDNSNVTILNVNEFKEAKSYSIWFDTTDGVKVNYHVVQQ
ncbi:DUF4397 domain-containing protein [Pedobacter xixiisoli]|uniref:DUF4397 domain-containing protein n=1 Tax=Pedobacter xixiisoli TaxID=1476464 RepID=UPI001486E601|nr:DUF4397 domain-containing protein [Pedobacter xixiisoli]